MRYDRERLINELIAKACEKRNIPSDDCIECAKGQFQDVEDLDLVTLLTRVLIGERGHTVPAFDAACRVLYPELTLVANAA